MQPIEGPSTPLCVWSLNALASQRHAWGVPDGHNTVDGIILLTSTRGSTRQLARNSSTALEGGIISDPHWSYLDVWWYPGLVTLNFHGITDPKYQGTQLVVNFGVWVQIGAINMLPLRSGGIWIRCVAY